ncbi:hypothetical protein CJ738_36790, partial [Klebsiella pneumoniae]
AGMLFSCTSKAPKSLVTPPNAASRQAGQAHRELIAAGMLFSCTSKAPKSLVTPPNAASRQAGQAHRE